MKKEKEKESVSFVLTKDNLLKKNPIPFGDVRKYYLAAKVGTIVLFALLLYMSFASVLSHTDYNEQISGGIMICLLLFSLASVIGVYSRTILGYGITALSSLILFVLLQCSNGTGIAYGSESLFYGEYFIKGIQSMAFWVILSKVLAILQTVLAILFIRSTITVTEEPAATGMNEKIAQFRAWLVKHNDSLEDGRRPLDYWFAAASILLYMGYVVGDSTMLIYDYISLALFLTGLVLVACRKILPGAFFCSCSALLRCNMYQYRFGYILPVLAAYIGLWLAIVYMLFASSKKRRNTENTVGKRVMMVQNLLMWEAVAMSVFCYVIHQVLGDFVHEFLYLSTMKDNLPIIFFVPIMSLIILRSGHWFGCFGASAAYLYLWSVFHQIPNDSGKNPLFDCVGSFQANAEKIMSSSISFMEVISLASCVLCFTCGVVTVVMMKRRNVHENREQIMD